MNKIKCHVVIKTSQFAASQTCVQALGVILKGLVIEPGKVFHKVKLILEVFGNLLNNNEKLFYFLCAWIVCEYVRWLQLGGSVYL